MTAPVAALPRSMARDVVRLCARELRACAPLAWLSLGLEVGRALLLEWVLRGGPGDLTSPWLDGPGGINFSPIDLTAWLLTTITTAIVVQADHPTDDRAFWRTRPIPPASLATAKIVTLALLFVAIPAMTNGVRLAAYGASLTAIAATAVSLALSAGVTVVPAWLLALVTGTVARFLATAIGLFAAYVAGEIVMPLASRLIGGMAWGNASAIASWRPDRHGWPGGLLATAVALGVLVRHYVHRRLSISVAALLLLAAAASLWPTRAEPLARASDAARVSASHLGTPAALELATRSLIDERRPFVYMSLRTAPSTPLPRDLSARVQLGAVRIRAGGQLVSVESDGECCAGAGAPGFVDPSYELEARRQKAWALASLHASGRSALALYTPRVTVEAEIRADLTRHRIVGELPARTGVAFRTDRYLLEIVGRDVFADHYGTLRTELTLRLARFPALAVADRCELALFWGRSDGVASTVPWWQHPGRVTEREVFDCARQPLGHDWVYRTTLWLPVDADRLLLVESLGVGRVSRPVVSRDIAVDAPETPARGGTPP
jgi:hypothetical protein